ncbi:MAG TPA: nucleotide-binding protein [Solirubrobacterales bacterium]|nr:nucleotide-binding protein [Solirubrobacterales bacterium]
MKPKLFVGSSGEALPVSRAVQAELTDEFDVTVWDQDVFQLTHSAVESLLQRLDASDAGIFVLRSDDLTEKRGVSAPSVRDNVLLELGMFLGRLGPDRTFMLTPGKDPPELPSDLLGITTAVYEAPADRRELQAAVAPACTKIRNQMAANRSRPPDEPADWVRLNRAMTRMGRDVEALVGIPGPDPPPASDEPFEVSMRIGRARVRIVKGLIQDYPKDGSVIALPANEYFDDECVNDPKSALGAYVKHHFGESLDDFLAAIDAELDGLPSQRVPRKEHLVAESYGIGQAIFLNRLSPKHRIILTSATTERAAIGLRAEPHFLYAAMQGTIETMNTNRLYSLVMPVFGSGHGGMPPIVALLFSLLAVRSCLAGEPGLQLNELCIVVFNGSTEVTEPVVEEILGRIGSAS